MDLIIASQMSRKEIESRLSTNLENGLSSEEAKKRLEQYGYNIIEEKKKKTLIDIVSAQFRNHILWLLLIAAIISLYINQYEEAIAIIIAILISIAFGTYLEYKANESIEQLSKYLEEMSLVIRDKKIYIIPNSELVPGDVIIINAGQKVPADCYIFESSDLELNEAVFTGESKAIKKSAQVLKEPVQIYKLKNILFANTEVLRGTAKAVVIKTGHETEIGKIAEKLKEIEQETTGLYKDMEKISKNISIIGAILVILILTMGFIKGLDINTIFIFALTLAVAVVPEGLTTVLTIILGLNVKKMGENNALIRRLSAIDNIGRINVIATDKTGTLTRGKMTLMHIYYDNVLYDSIEKNKEKLKEFLQLAYNATESKITDKGIVGDEIDTAITEVAVALQIKRQKPDSLSPFSSEKKYMSVKIGNKEIIKGASDVVMKMASHILINGKTERINRKIKEQIKEIIINEEKNAMKTIALAKRENGITSIIGFMFFSDPPKEEAKKTVEWLKNNNIRVVMLTGDDIQTAEAIARQIGIDGKAVLWQNIESLDENELLSILNEYTIIARSTPTAKLKIVEALIKKNVVCTIGDGINDALALKKSHISVVMGKMGATVSKEIADIVLIDDNIETLTKAINLGKNTIVNINNFLRFQLTANGTAIVMTILNFLINPIKSLILTPLQILWINIILDGPPALAQGFEEKRDIKSIGILDKNTINIIFANALFMGILCFIVFMLNQNDYTKALTYAFTLFVFFQIWNALNSRSIDRPFYEGVAKNKVMLLSLTFIVIMQSFLLSNETTLKLFDIEPLNISELGFLFLLSFSIVIFEETRKRLGIWTG
ncbi:MAG: cation-transporting P-type ATPase [Candidatus Anstonellales archaeon]